MTDITNPIITVVSPVPSSIDNSNSSSIEALITDGYGSGVNLSSIAVTINGAYAVKNGLVQAGFTGSVGYVSLTDVQVIVQRILPYQSLESVNVSISAQDVVNNPAATRVFSFITEDNSGAIIINPLPAQEATQVSPTTNIFFNIRQLPRETNLRIDTLRVGLRNLARDVDGTPLRDEDGNPILDGDGLPKEAIFVQPDVPFDERQVSIVADADKLGYSITIIPLFPLPLASVIQISIRILDQAGNITEQTYSFTTIDDTAPVVINQQPAPDSQANSIASPISFSVGDRSGSFLGSGVDLNTLVVDIDGQKAIQNGLVQTGFVGSITNNTSINGYDIHLVRSALFSPRTSINVTISAADLSGNLQRSSFTFGTEDVTPPQIQFIYPQDAATNIAQDTTIVVNIQSEVSTAEIDINSIRAELNGIEVYSNSIFDSTVTGTLSSSSPQILTLTLKSKTLLALGQLVEVAVFAQDAFGNLAQSAITFTVTSQLTLETISLPPGGIYYKANVTAPPPPFPVVGPYLQVELIANRSGINIYYTLDGSLPTIDALQIPQGSTQLYSAPFKIPALEGWRQIKYFAVDSTLHEQESVQTSHYFFTECPEQEEWTNEALKRGLEYTLTPKLIGTEYALASITPKLQQVVGTASYTHDLGRICYVDELAFDILGLSHFRFRIADTLEQLNTTPWCNQLLNIAAGEHITLQDGYATSISIANQMLVVEGRKRTFGVFNEEALAQVTVPLSKSFTLSADARLSTPLTSIVGAKSFLRLRDAVSTLEVQQIVSKINAAATNDQLVDQSSLIGEMPSITIDGYSILEPGYGEGYAILGVDGYTAITDGERGFTTLFPPPSITTQNIRFSYSKTLPIDSELVLEDDTTGIHSVRSISPAIYNTFEYEASEQQRIVFSDTPSNGSFKLRLQSETTDFINYDATAQDIENALNNLEALSTVTVTGDFETGFQVLFIGNDGGIDQPLLEIISNTLRLNFTPVEAIVELTNQGGVPYSSALTARVYYRNFLTPLANCFAISVANQPLDDTLARVQSLNLDARTDTYVTAETNDIFLKNLLLEEGDYTFRFRVVYNTTQGLKTRNVGNPFIFKTRQDLSNLQSGDVLVVGSNKYILEGAVRLPSNEYVLEFFEHFPPQSTDIVEWSIQRNNTPVLVGLYKINVLNPLQANVAVDAQGAVGNITVNMRETFTFQYVSSSASDVYLLGTFNDFNPLQDRMLEQPDLRPIAKAFDRNPTTSYSNDHINYHKIRVEPSLPIVVDRIRFYTDVLSVEKQRLRIQLDDRPVSKAQYLARKADGSIANYILEGYGSATESRELLSTSNPQGDGLLPILVGVPDLLDTYENDPVAAPPPVLTYATDIYASTSDGYVEWKYVQVGINKNRTLRSSIDLVSRFDSYSNQPRKHVAFDIFTLPSIPLPIADFVAPLGSSVLQRLNKSGFAASSNNVTLTYARQQTLDQAPTELHSLIDNGIVNNFYHATIQAAGATSRQVYVNMPHIFKVGEAVVAHDATTSTTVRTTVTAISSTNNGLLECAHDIPSQGRIVKDYIIEQDENFHRAILEVPNFKTVFAATVFDFTKNLDNTMELTFENPLGTDASLLLGGQLTYPTLEGVARVVTARNENIIVGGPIPHKTGSGADPLSTDSDVRGQIITGIGGIVQEIQVDVTRTSPGLSTGTLYAKIYSVAADGFTPAGPPLTTSASASFAVEFDTFQTVVLSFSSPIELDPVATYAIVWSGVGLGSPTGLRYSSSTTYADGLTIARPPGSPTWTSSASGNFVLTIVTVPTDLSNVNYQLKPFIIATIDRVISTIHPSLGCLIEAFNSTKRVVDYEISKTDGTAIFHNESRLGDGLSTITYSYKPVPYPAPQQMWSFEVLESSNVIQIEITPQQYQISLQEIDQFSIDFFDGVDGRAPSYVEFIVNNIHQGLVNYGESAITDGYRGGDYNPLDPTTGNIRTFSIAPSSFISLDEDGYGQQLLTSLSIRFSGSTNYCIGEVQSLVRTETLNSQCRIVLNDSELFKSPIEVGAFSRYKVQVEDGLVLIYFNGTQVLRRPLVLQQPTIEIGATAKVYDDTITAQFKNIVIDQFYTTSPTKIAKTGRYVEIEGTVIN